MIFCKSCIYNQDSKAVMNCNKVKMLLFEGKRRKNVLLYEKEGGIL
ncbi:hypothetical protein [Methanobrevibacter woesei]|nr:hypothetical protein [Methanobrevibacter woesei]